MIRQLCQTGLAVLLLSSAQISFGDATATDSRASVTNDREALVEAIAKQFKDERFESATWGVRIASLDSGEVWFELNPEKVFMPASNEKVPTTAATLLTLGPDYKYVTKVAANGEVGDGELNGDLVVIGTGDPTLYSRFYDKPTTVFEQWAEQLKEQRIERINGDIIGDDDKWGDDHVGNGWPFDDLSPWYYAEFGPLTFNENYVDVQIIPPATADGMVKLEPNVESEYFTIVNNVRVVEDGRSSVSFSRPHFSNTITFSGQVEAGSRSFERTPTITNPTLFYVTALKETLEKNGIEVTGEPKDIDDIPGRYDDPESLEVLINHQSAPLSKILAGLMKRSQNMYAETMVYTLGMEKKGKGTFRNGREVVQEALETIGVDPGDYRFSDGSGLSRYNYISPNVISKIYTEMLKSKYSDVWYECQSIGGVDGTLSSRFKDTKAQNNVRGKTGTIANTRALSGYVTTAAGEKMVFSMLVNGHLRSSSEVNDITDPVVVMLADYTGN